MREVVSVSDLFLFSLFSLLLHVLATGCFIYDPTIRQNYDTTTSVSPIRIFSLCEPRAYRQTVIYSYPEWAINKKPNQAQKIH